MVDNLKQGTFSQRKCDCGKTTTKIIVFSLKMARFGKDTRVIFVSAWNTSRDSCANSQHKDVDDIRLHLFPPNELMAFMSQEPLNVCTIQSHYREVPGWEIFIEQELRFRLDLGRLATLKKKFGRLSASFSCFQGVSN